MNKNKVIGKAIGYTIGYGVQAYAFIELTSYFGPETAFVLKTGSKYCMKGIKYIAKKSVRKDIDPTSVFSDAIDASTDAF